MRVSFPSVRAPGVDDAHSSAYSFPVGSKELIRRLEQAGFVCVRVNGSHHRYAHPDGRRVTVPHPKKDLGKGLVAQILKSAGLA